jgi:non-canonical (house-cleaning) NTP pyrophosphatase
MISVGSANPVKIEAVLGGFRRMFPGEAFAARCCLVESGVAARPMSDAETLRGATLRAEAAQSKDAEADYWVGVEGGCEPRFGELLTFAWIVVLARGIRMCKPTQLWVVQTMELRRPPRDPRPSNRLPLRAVACSFPAVASPP